MQRRNSYRDLGLTVSVSVFICILVKCLLFGFTWVSLLWLIFTCAYFYVTWRYPSEGAVVKHSTTAFLVLSFLAIVGIALFDRKARPVMHAFEGTGDTIENVEAEEEEPIVPIYVAEAIDTTQQDSILMLEDEYEIDSLLNSSGENPPSVENDTTIH